MYLSTFVIKLNLTGTSPLASETVESLLLTSSINKTWTPTSK